MSVHHFATDARAPKRILIVGYFGENNTGDEAILTAMLRGLRRYRRNLKIMVPSYGADPARLEKSYGVVSFRLCDLGRLFDAVEAADLVLLGGGGLLHDIWHPRPETMLTSRHFGLSYYCGIPWLAAQLGRPVMLYAVGVGPLLFREGEDLVRDVARAARIITVRDPASAEALRRLGVQESRVEITADPAWQLTPVTNPIVEGLLARSRLSRGPWLGVAVRNWNVGIQQALWERELLRGVEAFAKEHGLDVLFLPFQHGGGGLQDDLALARKLAAGLTRVRSAVLESPCAPEELLGVVGRCALMISMRLHAFIFACLSGTPTVALDYDTKVPVHATLLDPPAPAIKLAELTGERLRVALEGVWRDRAEWPRRQEALARQMHRRAERNTELALSLLDEEPSAFPSNAWVRIRTMLQAREVARADGAPERRLFADPTVAGRSEALRSAPADFARRIHRVVRIIAPQFFAPSGGPMIFGGSERYLIELIRVIRRLGHQVELLQFSNRGPWVRYYRDIRVAGVPAPSYFDVESVVYRGGARRPLLTIHLAFYTAGPNTLPPAIGISHGVYWDDPFYHVDDRLQWHQEQALKALASLDTVVSVDANTINWVRAQSPRLAERCVRIPNFVDLGQFHPVDRPRHSGFVILFPRRLVAPRGFWLVAEILPHLLAKYPEVEFHFVGQASGSEETEVRRFVSRYPGRVRWDVLPPERMPEAYQAADVVVIPTVCAEGTSLSCLEAQAAGKPVIATRVGGLSELILDEHNGLLIEPNAAALRAAIERVILDRALLARLAARAFETAQTFSLDRWQARWEDLLRTFLPAVPEAARPRARRVPLTALFPAHIRSEYGATESAWVVAQMLARKGVDTFWVADNPDRSSTHPRLQILPVDDVLHMLRPLVFVWEPEQESWVTRLEQPQVVRLNLCQDTPVRSHDFWRTTLQPIIHAALRERSLA
jgi:polysaccharide pyruvyl transferase CsaB